MLRRKHTYNRRRYAKLKREGKTAIEAYSIAKAEGLGPLDCMKMLCNVYQMAFADAKEVMSKNDYGSDSLSEYQEKHILPMLKEFLESEGHDIDRRVSE